MILAGLGLQGARSAQVLRLFACGLRANFPSSLLSSGKLSPPRSQLLSCLASAHSDRRRHDMDVTRENFSASLPAVRDALNRCSFFALDCEFTGLHLHYSPLQYYTQGLGTRYREWSASAQHFIVVQFGLSAFCPTATGLEAVTFNFWLFPHQIGTYERSFSCQAGSLRFLVEQGFDFNKCFSKGINSMSAEVRDVALRKLQQQQEHQEEEQPARRDRILSSREDLAFVNALNARVNIWLQSGKPELILDEVNRYLRGLQWLAVRKLQSSDPGAFRAKTVTTPKGAHRIRLSRVNEEQEAVERQEAQEAEAERLRAAAGFTEVFEAMRDCGRPAVVHNGIYDLHYSLHSFAGPLPRSWSGFKALAQRWFPGGIYDTKLMLRHWQQRSQVVDETLFPMTSLGAAYEHVTQPEFGASVQRCLGIRWREVQTQLAPGCERYQDQAFAHEAGYDAYMTGVVFANLANLLTLDAHAAAAPQAPPPEEESTFFLKGLRNWVSHLAPSWLSPASSAPSSRISLEHAQGFQDHINVSHTDIDYANLAGPDPVPFRSHVYVCTTQLHRSLYAQLAFEAHAHLGLGRPWITHGHGPHNLTLAFPCTAQDWDARSEAMVQLHGGRVPPGALTPEQRRDRRWVAAALLQQLPLLRHAQVIPCDFWHPAPWGQPRAGSLPPDGSDDEPEPKRMHLDRAVETGAA